MEVGCANHYTKDAVIKQVICFLVNLFSFGRTFVQNNLNVTETCPHMWHTVSIIAYTVVKVDISLWHEFRQLKTWMFPKHLTVMNNSATGQWSLESHFFQSSFKLYSSVSQTKIRGPPVVLEIWPWAPSKSTEKIKIQVTIVENLRVWKWHMVIAFHFISQYWHFMKLITLSIYRLQNCISEQKKRDLKHYNGNGQLMTNGNHFHFFSQYWHFMKFMTLPIYRLPSQGSPEFITEDQRTELFYIFMTFLIVFRGGRRVIGIFGSLI